MFSRRARLGAGLAGLTLVLVSCGPADDSPDRGIAAPAQQTRIGDFAAPAQLTPGQGGTTSAADTGSTASAPAVPGLGPQTSARIPAETTQVLVASGAEASSDSGTLSFFTRDGDTWREEKTFPFHNGSNGWLADRREGDKTTPIGVFSLSDAGGFAENPGTKLPYTRDDRLPSSATVAYGAEYASVFDYIIAIDYNRKPGTAPTDRTRPLGWDRGGGIWLHLDHDSGTNGCVTLEEEDLTWILTTLDPDAHPRIAMGPVAELQK